ncbi:MAG TPA: RidA family protein [Kofleriaceae bacterium]|nr:RidA family protein [Kofleriaceae bacterium]
MRHLNPPTLSAPRGYSHVVEVTSGRTLYVSGQIAVDPDGLVVGAGDFEAQTRQVFENLKAALAAAEATLADVVKITMFVTDISQLQTLRAVRDTYFTGAPPASSLVEVSRLVLPELMVEIEAIAVTGSPRRDPT